MEIERKYLIDRLPDNLEAYPRKKIEQAYLNTAENYETGDFLTYKGSGMMVREEYNLPLNKESYEHLREKADGIILSKTRYLIPLDGKLTIELDVFDAPYENLYLAEVEFETEEEAVNFTPPSWFGEDVTFSSRYHNSVLSDPASLSSR